jgi:hypothetical protein
LVDSERIELSSLVCRTSTLRAPRAPRYEPRLGSGTGSRILLTRLMRPSCSPELPAIRTWCREGHSKAQPRDYRSRALPLELSRRHGGVRRTDYFLFTKRAHRQQCSPCKTWSWRGESNPGFILTWFIVINDVSCPNWTTSAMWNWWSYSKTQPPRYECGALPLELHQRIWSGRPDSNRRLDPGNVPS